MKFQLKLNQFVFTSTFNFRSIDMNKYQIYGVPFLIALSNGILSVFGLSAGYEYYFFIAAILFGVIALVLSRSNYLLRDSIWIGVLIAAATGVPQAVFMDAYFLNNPDYAELGNTLPLNPRTYTLVMIPVFGTAFGLLIAGLSWIFSRIVK